MTNQADASWLADALAILIGELLTASLTQKHNVDMISTYSIKSRLVTGVRDTTNQADASQLPDALATLIGELLTVFSYSKA
jgi:hypothetical protein